MIPREGAISFPGDCTRREISESNTALNNPRNAKQKRNLSVLGWLILVSLAFLFFSLAVNRRRGTAAGFDLSRFFAGIDSMQLFAWVCVVLGAFLVVGAFVLLARQGNKSTERRLGEQQLRWTLTRDAVYLVRSGSITRLAWQYFVDDRETKRIFVLKDRSANVFAFAKRHMNMAEIETVRELLQVVSAPKPPPLPSTDSNQISYYHDSLHNK